MKKIYFFIAFIFTIQSSISQKTKEINFPNDYFGVYSGDLIIHSNKTTKKYSMEFHLLPTDSIGTFSYSVVYGKDEARQERKYTLKELDKNKGNYILDENNGILLDCKLVENKMYFLFEVMDSFLATFVTFNKDHLIFEIVVTNTKSKNSSGGTDKDIPEVISYSIDVIQKAVLKRH